MATIENDPALDEGSNVAFTLRLPEFTQQFVISREALSDLEGARKFIDSDLLSFFKKHEKRIIQVAEKKHGAPSNGAILLRTSDFA